MRYQQRNLRDRTAVFRSMTARNAMARASQFHPELKAEIRAKVHRKFPDIKLDD